MKILTAKKLEAHFIELVSDWRGEEREREYSYPVYKFESGLVMVPDNYGTNYFFDSEENIDGCGLSRYAYSVETGEVVKMTALELARCWGAAVAEFQDGQLDCLEKVKETLR